MDGEQLARTIDIIEKIVGRPDVIQRDIEPDLIKVLLGTDGFGDLRQKLVAARASTPKANRDKRWA
jgi:hypothetical protein